MEEPAAAARAAGLRYVNDDEPGIRRLRRGKGFVYVDAQGRLIEDDSALRRIRGLVIPPAWTDVWICSSPRGHIQATGRDARGRKQYRYHALWRTVRDEAKYGRTVAFARALPALRRRVQRDLARPGLPREKMVALVVRLLDTTLLRVGNEEYARTNRSFGLTTLRNRHVQVRGERIRFSFRGKSGKTHEVGLRDRRLARVLRQVQDLPGQRVFQYRDGEGNVVPIDSDDVNEYLREAMGDDFSAKDFRTWAGTVLAARELRALDGEGEPSDPPNKRVVRAVASVAQSLGNTPTVCRNCYIHPQIVDSYLDGSLARAAARSASAAAGGPLSRGLRADERLVLRLLRRRSGRAREA